VRCKREAGANPARGRHRDRGRNLHNATDESREGAGSRMIRKSGDLPSGQETTFLVTRKVGNSLLKGRYE